MKSSYKIYAEIVIKYQQMCEYYLLLHALFANMIWW